MLVTAHFQKQSDKCCVECRVLVSSILADGAHRLCLGEDAGEVVVLEHYLRRNDAASLPDSLAEMVYELREKL